MIFEALQARYGDCLLVTFPGEPRPRRLLIDGGPSTVFRTALGPRLEAERRAFPGETPLEIDAVMVSHIDEDHIYGLLELFETLQDADQRKATWPYRPRWLLHNSFDALSGEGEGGAARALGQPTVLAGLGGLPALPNAEKAPEEAAALVFQSYGQGSRLTTLAAALRISRNPPDQKPLAFDETQPRVLMVGNASLTVIGPLQSEIDALRREWAKWKSKQSNLQALAAYVDQSVPNLSSLVVLLEHEGRKVLLTGDARGDKILDGLARSGRPATKSKPLKLDILKLPHHGSSRNLTPEFFQAIRADHYVMSGDGTYGNPDRDTLLWIEQSRPTGQFSVHLTYDAAACDATHQTWAAKRSKTFDPGVQSIADVVARWKAENRITVFEGPVSINL